jgi:hypothetical protein
LVYFAQSNGYKLYGYWVHSNGEQDEQSVTIRFFHVGSFFLMQLLMSLILKRVKTEQAIRETANN